ncbi:MAG: hypothetical protein H6506_01750 [Calditrichaeota bacterium]|nr:hypothetical protein [Calditrichota bacterium]MCB9391355.1 hypothetical protein [Calditrichota bacterium]
MAFLASLAQTTYAPEDWVSYRDCRGARGLDASEFELFVATGGGVLTYQLNRGKWEPPQVMGYGSFEAIPIEDALLVLYDELYNTVWVATRDKMLKWQRGFGRWEVTDQNPWLLGERPVNIGVGEGSLYVETIPEHIFDQLFYAQPPLPDPEWIAYVKRYSGGRNSGRLSLDMTRDGSDAEKIRWRGLRTRVPISNAAYPPGVTGQQPAGLPYVFPPKPYTWHNDGTLYDPQGRAFLVTDWLVDTWGGFWSTHWGAGVLRVDLRTQTAEQYLTGPAGNDMAALLFLDHELWTGGANDGDFMGISVLHDYGSEWSFFERRDNAQIRSTMVSDLAFADERVWLAATDGLLSFTPRKKIWKRYDVQDGLHAQQVTALAARDGELWVGTVDGVAVMEMTGNKIVRISSEGFKLSGVHDLVIADSLVYVGTNGGLTQIHRRTHEVTRLPLDPGLIHGPVLGLSFYGGELWLVTAQGVMRRDAARETKSWLSEVHLSEAIPTCIEASDPYVWVGTESGFFRFQPEREAWERYTHRDGLVNDLVRVIKEDRGDLWVGTAGGLTRYYWSRPGATK